MTLILIGLILIALVVWCGQDFGKEVDGDYAAHNPNPYAQEDADVEYTRRINDPRGG